MKIILLRHGKPEVDLMSLLKKRCSSSYLGRLVTAYEFAGLNEDDEVSKEVIHLAATCNIMVHSDLPRSVESVKALGVNNIHHCSDAIFREPNLPYANWKYPKLPLLIWFLLFRVMWHFGYSNNAESIKKARKNAATGARILREYSKIYGTVILVGHGVVNKFIAKELLSAGWAGPKSPGNEYWSYGIYTNNDT
ncbi:MAG: hypothetical protein ACC707_06985, partial [Thiohalomonadales bacterium]